MSEYKRKPLNFLPFDYEYLEEKFRNMAKDGWILEDVGTFFWKFRKGAPCDMKYSVVYFPNASAYDPDESDLKKEFAQFCEGTGWKRVCGKGKMQIYANDDPGAVPIDTDEEIKYSSIKRSMAGAFIAPNIILLPMILFINDNVFTLIKNPALILSDYALIFTVLMTTIVICLILLDLACYGLWVLRSNKSVRDEGCMKSAKPYGKVSRTGTISLLVVWPLCFIPAILNPLSEESLIMVSAVFVAILTILAVSGLSRKMQKMGVSRGKNLGITVVATFLLVIAVTSVPVIHIFNALDDEEEYINEHKETIFLSHDHSDKPIKENGKEIDVDYDLYKFNTADAYKGFFYKWCLKGIIDEGGILGSIPVDTPDEGFEEVKDSKLPVVKAYKYKLEDPEDEDVENSEWILCFKDRIARVYLDEGCTDDEMRTVCESISMI